MFFGKRALGEFDVAVMHAVDALGAAEIGALGQPLGNIAVDQLLDLMLELVGELVAVRAEQLDAVVVVRIVRGGDHHAEIGAHRAREHGDGRRRHRAEQQHIHADRGEARDQRGLDHIAGETGVLADDHAMAMLAAPERRSGRLADAKREFGRNDAIGPAANAVCAKISADHRVPVGPCAAAGARRARLYYGDPYSNWVKNRKHPLCLAHR